MWRGVVRYYILNSKRVEKAKNLRSRYKITDTSVFTTETQHTIDVFEKIRDIIDIVFNTLQSTDTS